MVSKTSAMDNVEYLRNVGVYFIANIRYNLIKKKQNAIFVIVGKPGSGKSTAAIALAKAIDPNWDLNRIVWTGNQYVNVLRDVKPGEAVVWDETGVGLGSREAMTKISRNLSKVFQTMRFKRNAIIMTVPSQSYIDKTAREMVDAIIELNRIVSSYKLAFAKVMTFKKDNIFDRTYTKYPVIRVGNKHIKLKKFAIVRPAMEILRRYEVMKEEFFNKNVLDKFDEDYSLDELKMESKKREELKKNEFIAEKVKEILKNPNLFGRPKYGSFSISKMKVRGAFGTTNGIAEDIKAKAEYELGKKMLVGEAQ